MLLGARVGKSGPWIMILLRHIYSWHRYTHRLLLLMMIISEYWISLPLHSLSHCMLFHYPTWKPLPLPFSLPPLPFSQSEYWHMYMQHRHTYGEGCSSPATIFNMTPCLRLWPQSMCYWWNPSRREHTHMLAHRHTLVAHSTIQSHTVRPQWLILADPWWPIKRAWRLTGCSAALIYWVGSVVSLLLLCCNYFLFA